MGYQVKCDWCDAPVDPDDDHAVLEVVVNRHKEVRSLLDRKWAQETRPTLHFCVEPRESTDRMGLVETEGEPDDCYQRAMAAIHLRATERPDMGMEWRLVPIDTETHQDEAEFEDRSLWEEGYPGLLARELCDAGLDLPLPKRLHEVGIDTLGDLRRAVEAESLLTVKGIGPAKLKSLRERLDTIVTTQGAGA
jgi:hypothetical protein